MGRSRIPAFIVCAWVIGSFSIHPARAQVDDLEEAPWVQGDSIGGRTSLTFRSVLSPLVKPLPDVAVPASGGTARLTVADNNKALPQDRIYFNYNHFENAFQVEPGAGSGQPGEQFSVSRYTVGFEKLLFSDLSSVEVRVPFTGTYQFFTEDFSVRGANAGNLAVIIKQLITRTENVASVMGLGFSLPTGTDVNGNVFNTIYTIQNESIYLLPYWGLLATPDNETFFHAFLSLDLVANGNPVFASSGSGERLILGTFTEQALFYVDVAVGRWLFRNEDARFLTGVAASVEWHYTTSLQDADQVGGVVDTTLLEFTNPANRSDVLNATVGFNFELARNTLLRVGGAFPLRNDLDRNHDAEVAVQLVHRFGANAPRSGLAPVVSLR